MNWFPPALALALLVASAHHELSAATFTVTTAADSGGGSLREAIGLAEADTALDTIDFNTGVLFAVARTISLTSGPLIITRPVLIDAPDGANRVTIDGGSTITVFDLDLDSGNVTTFDHLTIRNGGGTFAINCNRASTSAHFTLQNCIIQDSVGGGVSFFGTLTGGSYGGGNLEIYDTIITGSGSRGLTVSNAKVIMERCDITDNVGVGAQVSGEITMDDCDLSGNADGGVYMLPPFDSEDSFPEAALTMLRCLVSGNARANSGGGISASDTEVELVDCTISGNEAHGDGGGIALNDSDSLIVHCTITGNVADAENNGSGSGGGIGLISVFSDVTLRNSIVAGNSDTPGNAGSGDIHPDLSGEFVPRLDSSPFGDLEEFGNNLIGALDGATGFLNGENGDIVGTRAVPVPRG